MTTRHDKWTVPRTLGRLALGLAALAAVSAHGSNWYVRPAAAGANSGADWNNAWSTATINWTKVLPGDTVWLAGGSHAAFDVGASGTAANSIYIKRVLASDAVPVAAAGWQASFDSLVTIAPCIYLYQRSYVTIDGRVEYGIKIPVTGWAGAISVRSRAGAYTACNSTNIVIQYVEMAGPGSSVTDSKGIEGTGFSPSYIQGFVVRHCSIHDVVVSLYLSNWHDCVVEYSKIYNMIYNGGEHPDTPYAISVGKMIWRYNTLSNSVADGAFYTSLGGSTEQYWYGNIFNNFNNAFIQVGGSQGTFHVWNNTFYNSPGHSLDYQVLTFFTATTTAPTEFYNNIIDVGQDSYGYGAFGAPSGSYIYDYNYHVSGTSSGGGAHSINSGARPFGSGANSGNFALQAGSAAINAGITLANDGYVNVDMNGVVRGSYGNGGWSMGALEYGSGSVNTNPVMQVSPGALAFGPVAAGASATNTFTVQNAGAGTLSGAATVAASSTSFLQILSGGTYSLGAGQSQAVRVRYTPTANGTDNGSITCSGAGGAQVSVTGSLLQVLPGLTFPSYAGVITAPFTTNGGYVSQTVDVSGTGQAGIASGGQAVYAFNIPTAGSYTVSASVTAPSASSKSFWLNMDAQPTDPTMIWDVYPYTVGFETRTVSWRGSGSSTNDQYNPKVFSLSAGTHQLIVVGREAGVRLGQITIAPLGPTPPTNLRILSSSP